MVDLGFKQRHSRGRGFYRNFYRTGRNPEEVVSTVQQPDPEKRRSEALFNIDQQG